MIRRLSVLFESLKQQRRAGLITFIMGGDPDAARALELMHALPEAGADIIEIGMPFSDPMADGRVIEAAGLRALSGGMTLAGILEMLRAFRAKNTHTPVVLMGYYNPIYAYGVERFCTDAAKSGADGVILVDLPPEEEAEFTQYARAHGLALIRLIAPTSLDDRLPALLDHAQGFVYYIAVAGITGGKSAQKDVLAAQVARVKSQARLPVAVGFGIKTPQQAAEVAEIADAVVVGSALVDLFHREGQSAALEFVRSLAAMLCRE